MAIERFILLGAVEAAYNRDPGLNPVDHAIMVEGLSSSICDPTMIERDPVSANKGGASSRHVGHLKQIGFKLRLRGSGTANVPPDAGLVLQCAGLREQIGASSVTYSTTSDRAYHKSSAWAYYEDGQLHKLTGARVEKLSGSIEGDGVLDVTLVGHDCEFGTAQGGGAATIILAADHAAVDGIYVGQRITVAGQERVISAYVGATRTATVSVAWTTPPAAGAAYTIDNGPIDVAMPSPTYDDIEPPAAVGLAFKIGTYPAAISSLSFDVGAKLAKPKWIGSPDGYGTLQLTARAVTGSCEPERDSVANKDWQREWAAGTAATIDTGSIGSVAGNRYRIQMLRARQKEAPSAGNREGILTRKLSFGCDGRTADGELVITFD